MYSKVISINIYVCRDTYIHIITVNGKRGHGFEGEQEGSYGRVWREERVKMNVVIRISKINKTKLSWS